MEMRHVTYSPRGVCSVQLDFDLDSEGKIHNMRSINGCNGNLKAIGRLIEGRNAAEVAAILNVLCGSAVPCDRAGSGGGVILCIKQEPVR